MGGLLAAHDARFVTDTLNWLFNDDLANTFRKVEKIRAVFPEFLNPSMGGDSKIKRRQTLRFAALLLTDGIPFDADYPARKFKQWLKWLTWLQVKSGGSVTVNSVSVNYKASRAILEAISAALPPGGANASPIVFHWDEDTSANGTNFAVDVVTTTNPATIMVVSIRPSHGSVTEGSDEEDDI